MLVKLGDKGESVRLIEKLLSQRGYQLIEDAYFDENTQKAVLKYQADHGLVVDGIVGRKTLKALRTATATATTLGQSHIENAAIRLGVSVAAVLAVNEVESQSSGFLDDGRVVILYERHVMYKRLKAEDYDADSYATKSPNIVNARMGGYRGGAAEHSRLRAAQAIDHDIALESCSWGQYQIMGYHWDALGYQSVQHFVELMSESEANQLDAFVKFIELDSNLHKALKAKKWTDFAKLYNGPAYARNFYDVKLARAYAHHAAEHGKAIAA